MAYINPLDPSHAYMLGFIFGDGHLQSREDGTGRGKLSIEINIRDRHILEEFKQMIPVNSSLTSRYRITHFSKSDKSYDNHTVALTVFDQVFRYELFNLGLPPGKKSWILDLPKVKFSRPDFWRGMIDANGSLGLDSQGLPFISFVTASAQMAQEFLVVIWWITKCCRQSSRNKRDNVFNIMVPREPAQQLIRYLYYPGCLALERKKEKAEQALGWQRPLEMEKRPKGHSWTEDEEEYVLSHSVRESMDHFGLTKNQVSMKRRHLGQATRKQ